MAKRVILITGTPCVGKTTVARQLAKQLGAIYVNLTDLAIRDNLIVGEDKDRHTIIVDEAKMRVKLSEMVEAANMADVIVDGHYAAAVMAKDRVDYVFVFRRNPIQLRKFMRRCGFRDQKLWENLASEILDVCLVEALREQEAAKVCELDVTGKSSEQVLQDVLAVLENRRECGVGGIDWIGALEREGKLEEYLRV